VLSRALALVAHSDSAGKALFFDLLKARIVGRKVFLKLLEGVAKLGGDCLAAIHATALPDVLLVVKG